MSWLKAKDWASGVEYSSLFHSGLRAISLRSLIGARTRAQSTTLISSPEKTKRRCSLSLSSCLFKRGTSTKSPPTSKSSLSPPCTEKCVRPRPSSMFVCSTNELCEPWGKGGSFFDNRHGRQKLMCAHFLQIPLIWALMLNHTAKMELMVYLCPSWT